jgi:hypothetical protein
MTTPMMGAWTVEVRAVKPFTIHGDLYYELHVIRTDVPADTMTVLRVPQHATAGEPKVGDRLNVTFLMGQVTGTRPET